MGALEPASRSGTPLLRRKSSDTPNLIRRAAARIRPHRAVLLVAFCFFALATLYGVVNPLFESYDEEQHFLFVKQLADGKGLPVREITPILKETHQAPLYYTLAALITFYVDTHDVDRAQRINPSGPEPGGDRVAKNHNKLLHGPWEAFPWRGTVLAAHIARLLSAILGTLTVFLTYLLAREVFPTRKNVALLAAIGVAVNVQFTYISGAVSNDILVACLSSAAFLPLLRTVRLGLDRRRTLCAGILIGLAALAKASGILLLPIALLALFVVAIRDRTWSRGLRSALWLIGPVMIICGWWYVRNQVLYGDWSGLRNVYLSGAGRSSTLPMGDALAQLGTTVRSFYLPWGWTHFRVPEPIYVVALAVLGLGLLGAVGALIMKVLRRETTSAPSLARRLLADASLMQLAIMLIWGALSVAAVVRYVQVSINAESGRFLFPAISAVYVAIAWGWLQVTPSRLARYLPLGLGAPGLVWSFAYLWLFLVPSYAPPPLLGPAALNAVQVRLDAHLDDTIALLGNDPLPATVSPGDTLAVGVYWQSLGATDKDYMVFVHLVDRAGGNVAQVDTYTGLGNLPTSAWRPGDAFRDVYRLAIPAKLSAPQLLDIEVGMYVRGSDDTETFTFGDGRTPTGNVRLGQVKLLPRQPIQPPPQDPRRILFGQSIKLSSFGIQRLHGDDGDRLSLTLVWQAIQRMEADYTVFVHVLDGVGRIVAQTDEQPKRGRFPTSYWEKDQVVEDQHDVSLPKLQPGTYRVLIGLSDQRANLRLMGESTATSVVDGAAMVAEFTVEKR